MNGTCFSRVQRSLLYRRSFFFCLFFVGIFFFGHSTVAFQITPARQTAVLELGSSQIIPLTITNNEDAPRIFTPEISAFAIESDTGSPVFDQPDEATAWFRVLPERLLLQPGQSGTFSFTVSVPRATEAKSHYLGLFARAQSGGGQVGISTRLGSLLFLHITGDIREELIRKTFSSDTQLYRGGEITLRLMLQNAGSIHLVPDGTVTVRSHSGETVAVFPINSDQRKILPNGLWEEEYRLSGLSAEHMGRLRVRADIRYGLSQKELHDSFSIWFVSDAILFSGIALIGICFCIFFYWRQKKGVSISKKDKR